MIVARNVSAMAAELGTMKVTQQIDALEVMAVNPVNFLVVPRVVAMTIMLPALVIISNAVGNIGGYLVGVNVLSLNPTAYIKNIQIYIDLSDLTYGLIKAGVFGFIVSLIGCYMGLTTQGGAKGVGNSTTKAVVAASISVLVADYFLTAFLF
jgi:phospholipid/cholesterol/gamma-HCH transport system permease protein